MSRLAEIYKAQKEKGGSFSETLGSTLKERAKEKFDPRQIIDQEGLLATMFPSLKAYKSKTSKDKKEKSEKTTSPKQVERVDNLANEALLNEIKSVRVFSEMSAKNTTGIPSIARDINVMRQGIIKLVKLSGGKQQNKADSFFKKSQEEETAYESAFGKKDGLSKDFKPEEKKDDQKSGLINLISNLMSSIGGLGKTLAPLLSTLTSFVPKLLSGLTSLMPAVLSFLASPAGIVSILAVAAGLGIKKLLEDAKEGEAKKDDLSKLRQKKESGQNLTPEEEKKLSTLEKKGITETTGEATNRAVKSSVTYGEAKQVVESDLSDDEIKQQYGVSRKVLTEYVKREGKVQAGEGGKVSALEMLSREMGEEYVGPKRAKTNARRTGDKGIKPEDQSAEIPKGSQPINYNGELVGYKKEDGSIVALPGKEAKLKEAQENARKTAHGETAQVTTPASSVTPAPTPSAASAPSPQTTTPTQATSSASASAQYSSVSATQATPPTGAAPVIPPTPQVSPIPQSPVSTTPQATPSKGTEIEGGLAGIRTKSGRVVQVASKYAGNFQGFINDLEATGYQIKDIGGYAYRQNVNDPSKLSYHARGMSIDINPAANPNKSTKTDLPQETNALARKWGLGWGMNWTSVKDPMHFSIGKEEGGTETPKSSSPTSPTKEQEAKKGEKPSSDHAVASGPGGAPTVTASPSPSTGGTAVSTGAGVPLSTGSGGTVTTSPTPGSSGIGGTGTLTTATPPTGVAPVTPPTPQTSPVPQNPVSTTPQATPPSAVSPTKVPTEGSSYASKVGSAESGGKYDTVFGKAGGAKINDKPVTENTIAEVAAWQATMKSTNRHAAGKYQFMDVAGIAAQAGLKPTDKFDGAAQEKMMGWMTQQNAKVLAKNGIEASDANLHLAHSIGAGGVIKIYNAKKEGKGNVPVADVLGFAPGSAARKTNPHLEATVDQYIATIGSKHAGGPTLAKGETGTGAATSPATGTEQVAGGTPTSPAAEGGTDTGAFASLGKIGSFINLMSSQSSGMATSPSAVQTGAGVPLTSGTGEPVTSAGTSASMASQLSPVSGGTAIPVAPQPQTGQRLTQMNAEVSSAREQKQAPVIQTPPPTIIQQPQQGGGGQQQMGSMSSAAPASVYDKDVVDSLFKRQGPSYSLA